MSYGTLYLCATPIGNLQDITLRVLETLKTVDLVACEDTRKTLQLLNHFEISKPVTSYYEHNKMSKGDVIIQQLKDGKNIALVSDAGMPGISDPGYDLVQQCLAEDIPFTVLPGAVAAVTGLVLSGLPTDRFSFEGFIPRQKKERLQYFQNLVQEERTMIFYESPHRLEDTLKTLIEVFPDRPMAAARELTKKFEEIVRGTPSEVLAHFEAEGIRGEFVLLLHGADPAPPEERGIDWAVERVAQLEADGISQKDAIKQAAKEAGLSKRDVYNFIVQNK
ncbi:MAG: 16S rRNA (cytidine(1402)-2'-O)-methyltransferase [Peptococcaceae bacterium]|jgi:16S rRNA (cytidine1402-2'-O)-methyltransferase|nr:16S rRNA (cytidine(1402)-2'-O)-methyltransferase [Peptococcaceae bacterium]MBQ2014744.1 16S rRNA (cytidine(1402)-2'-O)-methyltransferase [Peptococcaceae bacterium]MBQ2036045.1 16S rRNA (cytidine(1402)-2'-O)-methyltransferase [Peptococcaceae bacterium]MBQ2120330.1 16S rRNA (cytidine(1402)-2'-O)-methyltransferase [Peptococcaceae bacterium]MBQ2449245.1 16S rRNA (cytidine(1402)-2'-O)-methyltransferase [Peptococcaceae bacterium]